MVDQLSNTQKLYGENICQIEFKSTESLSNLLIKRKPIKPNLQLQCLTILYHINGQSKNLKKQFIFKVAKKR
jgi:hypothetical protein